MKLSVVDTNLQWLSILYEGGYVYIERTGCTIVHIKHFPVLNTGEIYLKPESCAVLNYDCFYGLGLHLILLHERTTITNFLSCVCSVLRQKNPSPAPLPLPHHQSCQ